MELFEALFCKILLKQFANCNLETGTYRIQLSSICITSWVFYPQQYWSILRNIILKNELFFFFLYCSALIVNVTWSTWTTGILGKRADRINLCKFCVLKTDVSFIARLFRGQNSFRSGRNTADWWCWRTTGLDLYETFCLSWHMEDVAYSYVIIITLSALAQRRIHRMMTFSSRLVFRTKLKHNWSECDLEEEYLQGKIQLPLMLIHWNEKIKSGKWDTNDVQITLARG